MTVRGGSNVTAISRSKSRACHRRCRVDHTRVLATLLVRFQSRHVLVMQRGAEAACSIRRQTAVHRALQCGAVLGLVNALRFASTRPAAGPSGIDDTCARHDVGDCAMAGFLMARAGRESEVDAGFAQAYV